MNLPLKEFESITANRYYEKYRQLSLLPSVRSMQRYLKGIDQTGITAKIREHLYANLRSAFCFHRSIGLEVVKGEREAISILKECQENERIRVAERFIKHVEPRLANTALPTTNRNGTATVIIFAGHCHPTYYRGRLVENRFTYLRAPEGRDESQGNEPLEYEYGDGRVPVWSAGWERPVGGISPGYTFFLCEDHVGLVKNQSFRYKLLRELLVIRSAVD